MDNTENEKSPIGKLIVAAIGWFIIIMPFASYGTIGEEEYLTGTSWAIIFVLSAVYWTLILRSKWMNDE